MINASFDGGRSRLTAISGAYQYDTGQRLMMHGLPSPEEFSGEDDFLSGDLAVVEVHYSRVGDSQSEMRLGVWDIERKAWTAAVPDVYLQISEEIEVHVYVSHGEDGDTVRAKTMYEGVFTPIARPAPFGFVTPEQETAWKDKIVEIDLALVSADKAIAGALDVVDSTNDAAQEALEPAKAAQTAAQNAEAANLRMEEEGYNWERSTFSVTPLAPSAKATIDVERRNGIPHFDIGIPRGADGTPGEKGEKGPTDVQFYADGTHLIITTLK